MSKLIERALLGSFVLTQGLGEWAGLPANLFTGVEVRIFEAMLGLASKGRRLDELLLEEELGSRGHLAAVGWRAGIMSLQSVVGDLSSQESWVAQLREEADRRAMKALAEDLLRRAEDRTTAPVHSALAVREGLEGIGVAAQEENPTADLAELGEQWSEWVDRLADGAPTGLDDGVRLLTGIEALDAHAEGFMNNLNVLLGLASKGKTAIAAEVIWNWLKAAIPGGIVGLEDGTAWLTRRHLSRYVGIPVGKVGRTLLHDHQQARLGEWMKRAGEMYEKHLSIHRAGGLGAPDLLALCRRWMRKGARWIWIDHGLRVDYSAGAPERARYDMLVGRTLDALANMGVRHKVAIIVNWHLNRGSEEDVMPSMAQAKESGYLEAAARQMLAVWEQRSRPGIALVTCLKNTEGPRGWTVGLERDPDHALVKSQGGGPIDFVAEATAAAEAKRRQKASSKRKGFSEAA
jgi:replicative DNA helicase